MRVLKRKSRFESRKIKESFITENKLIREFKQLSTLLNSLQEQGVDLNKFEIEMTYTGCNDEWWTHLSCSKLAKGDMSEVKRYIESNDRYIDENIPIDVISDYNKYGVPEFADGVTVEILCSIKPKNNDSFHFKVDVFKYEIDFPIDGDKEVDFTLAEDLITLKVQDTKRELTSMMLF